MNRHSIDLRQGTLHYRDEGRGPTIVFVHGLLVSGSVWDLVVDRLADRFRCIAPDWPLGSHEEPMRADADLSPAGIARMIADFLEALDLRDVTLVGNDSGGAICQLVMTSRPERLARVVLTTCDAFEIFPPPIFDYLALVPKIPGLAAVMLKSMSAIPALARLPIAYGLVTKRPLETRLLKAWTAPAARSAEIRRDVVKFIRGVSPRVTLEVAKRIGDVRLPVLVLWTPEDRSFPLSLGERLARTLPRATLETIDDAWVFAALDRPAEVAASLARFVGAAARASEDVREAS